MLRLRDQSVKRTATAPLGAGPFVTAQITLHARPLRLQDIQVSGGHKAHQEGTMEQVQ